MQNKVDLTEMEKQEALRCIEEGRPLPDKYRFLLFEDNKPVELVWPDKTTEVTNIVLPFQTIEVVDEPRTEKPSNTKSGSKKDQMGFFDDRGRQMAGWTNKLIWGDNKLILSSLKNGPLRQEIEEAGGLKLIYIDPPFDVGADFSMQVEVGGEELTKKPNVLEELAYRDTWGEKPDSFIAMIYERLSLMRDLLADDGSIYVHCDWRVNSYIRLAMDEIFGKDNFLCEITWQKLSAAKSQSDYFSNVKDSIFLFSQYKKSIFKPQFIKSDKDDKNYPYTEKETGRRYGSFDFTQKGTGPARNFGGKVLSPPPGKHWIWKQDKIDSGIANGRIFFTSSGLPRVKRYLDEKEGNYVGDLWNDDKVSPLSANSSERLNYPTQKPEALLQRIIKASSNEGDLVADFFCGSGTTLAVAEKLGRKWIGSDLGKFAIHTSRKRMISVQRDMKTKGQNFRAFEILNLGKYERQHYIGVNMNLREKDREKQLAQKEKDYVKMILQAYSAKSITGSSVFHGKKNGRMVIIGPVNHPLNRLFTEEVIKACKKQGWTKADILAFEFEMGLFPNIRDEAKRQNIDLALKYIPKEVFDKRAVEKNQVVFADVSYIDFKIHINKGKVAVTLTDFSTYYSQGESEDQIKQILKNGKQKITVQEGKIIKITKDQKGTLKTEILTKKWTDWIDYWAVDFDFESKKEIIKIKDLKTNKITEKWTGDYIFENEWQSFRTKKDRSITLKSAFHKCQKKGRRKIAVKVVDIFGNDTMKVIEVQI